MADEKEVDEEEPKLPTTAACEEAIRALDDLWTRVPVNLRPLHKRSEAQIRRFIQKVIRFAEWDAANVREGRSPMHSEEVLTAIAAIMESIRKLSRAARAELFEQIGEEICGQCGRNFPEDPDEECVCLSRNAREDGEDDEEDDAPESAEEGRKAREGAGKRPKHGG